MSNILTTVKHIHKYLEEEYLPEQEIYHQFLKCYEKVKAIRAKRQVFADGIRAYHECVQKLKQERANYQKELRKKENELHTEIQKIEALGQECRQQLEQLQACLEVMRSRAEVVRNHMDNLSQCLQLCKAQKPFFFAGRKRKEEYRERVNEITSQFAKLSEEDAEYRKQERKINEKILLWQRKTETKRGKTKGDTAEIYRMEDGGSR